MKGKNFSGNGKKTRN